MFVGIDPRRKTVIRWATPVLFAVLWLAYVVGAMRAPSLRLGIQLDWGALSGGLDSLDAWRGAFIDGSVLRLFSACSCTRTGSTCWATSCSCSSSGCRRSG